MKLTYIVCRVWNQHNKELKQLDWYQQCVLLEKILYLKPNLSVLSSRLTASQCLEHKWLKRRKAPKLGKLKAKGSGKTKAGKMPLSPTTDNIPQVGVFQRYNENTHSGRSSILRDSCLRGTGDPVDNPGRPHPVHCYRRAVSAWNTFNYQTPSHASVMNMLVHKHTLKYSITTKGDGVN